MRLKELLEQNDDKVVDITKKSKQSDRLYGYQGYKTVLDNLLGRGEKENIEGISADPKIKPMKRYTPQAISKALKAIGFPEEQIPEMEVETFLNEQPPRIAILPFPETLISKDVDKRVSKRWLENWEDRFLSALMVIFGRYVEYLTFEGMMQVPTFVLSQSYFDAVNSNQSKQKQRQKVSNVINQLFKKHDIGGLNFVWVNKIGSGYSVKIEGAEIVDQNSLKRLQMDLQQTFGDLFVKLKTDGEISSIGHRPVGPGLTNYRIYFTPELKQHYMVS